MDPRPPVAVPQGPGPLSCRICCCELQDRHAFNEHHRTPWHLYNMRRRSQQLPVVTIYEFERKIELLRLARQYAEGEGPLGAFQPLTSEGPQTLSGAAAEFHAAVRCNKKGRDHLKKPHTQQQLRPEKGSAEAATETDERTAAAKAAAAAWRAALQQYPERCNLFEQMPAFASAAENVNYMRKAYGFFIPDEEYCVNTAGLLRCLWREQQQQPRCLLCCKRFRGIRAAMQHMQQQRHFQLKWSEEQQDLLHRFYDYKKSYYELLERLGASKALQLQAHSNEGSEQSNPAEVAGDAEVAEITVEEESEWEDCSSDDGNGTTAASEQQKLEALLKARGWRHARVTDEGHLQLPNGQEVLHRSHAIFCRQRLRRFGPQLAEQCVLQDMAGVPPEHALDIRKQSLALCKREKLQRHLRMVGGEFSLQQPKRPLLQPQQRRLAWRREAEQQRKWQHQRMKLGIKANTLQRTILKETKFFL